MHLKGDIHSIYMRYSSLIFIRRLQSYRGCLNLNNSSLVFCSTMYSVVQKNSRMFEFTAFHPPTNLGLPMHSPSALTEHVSLNLARFFLLDPVYRNISWKQWSVDFVLYQPHILLNKLLHPQMRLTWAGKKSRHIWRRKLKIWPRIWKKLRTISVSIPHQMKMSMDSIHSWRSN